MWRELHPAWKVVTGLAMAWFITVAIVARVLFSFETAITDIQTQQSTSFSQLKAGEERSYILRAWAGCADIINDGEIEITQECLDPRVAAYYPPSICHKLPEEIDDCGSKAVVILSSSGG